MSPMSRDDHNDTFTSGMAVWAAAVLRQSSHTRALRPLAASVPTERTAREPGPAADRFFKPMGRDWLQHAACADADPTIFEWDEVTAFDLSPEWIPAEWYCKRCPVRGPCRAAGEGLPGMWGGRPNLIRRMDITYNGSGVHAELRDEAVTDEVTRYHGVCQAHGKRLFATRKEAKAAAKATELMHGKRRDVGPVTVYSCDENPRYHHWGHDVVKRDEIAADTRRANGKIAAMVAAAKGTTTKGDGKTMTAVAEPTVSTNGSPVNPNPDLRVDIEYITPDYARELLGWNTNNRKKRPSETDGHVRTMSDQKWDLNGETIKITKSGRLGDGQHRLEGAANGDKGFWSVVVRNVEDEAIDTVDIGIKRNLGEILKRAGYENGATLVAIVSLSLQVRYGRHYKATDVEKRTLIENDEALRWVVNEVLPTLPTKMATPTIFGYVYRVLHEKDAKACSEFFLDLSDPGSLPEGAPAKTLSRRLETIDRKSASWTNRAYILTAFFRSWNAYRAGETLDRLRIAPLPEGGYSIPDPV